MAQKRTEKDIEYLTEALESMKKYCSIHDKMIDYNTRFYRRMALATGNPIIPIIMEPIFLLLPEFISENFKLSHAPDKTIEKHDRLLDCMIRKADNECYDAMTTHMITAVIFFIKNKKIPFGGFVMNKRCYKGLFFYCFIPLFFLNNKVALSNSIIIAITLSLFTPEHSGIG